MELGKSEPLSVLNEHHCCVRHIDADLDDGSGDKDMDRSPLERLHHRLFLVGLHPAVQEAYRPLLEDVLLKLLLHVRRAAKAHFLRLFDKRIDDIGLAARHKRAPYGLVCGGPILLFQHFSLYGLSARRQLVYYRYIKVAEDCHGERPRYGRGSHDEYV